MADKAKVIVLRAAGTNCDIETKFAFEYVGAEADLVHINKLISGKVSLDDYHILAIPGGFTYGDDIAAGKILASQLTFKLKSYVDKFIKDDKLMIGICNGFQVLVKAGILPGSSDFKQEASLIFNDSAKFEDRWAYLKTNQDKCIWTKGIEDIIYLPIAHAEGKFISGSSKNLEKLKNNQQIVFQYVDKDGNFAGYPYNPNGSEESIARICDESGRILGLMPHPERNILFHHHPRWTRHKDKDLSFGVKIFKNAVEYIGNNL